MKYKKRWVINYSRQLGSIRHINIPQKAALLILCMIMIQETSNSKSPKPNPFKAH